MGLAGLTQLICPIVGMVSDRSTSPWGRCRVGLASELKKMYSWIKPSIVVPVHGEYHHLKGNIEVAKECGIKKGIIFNTPLDLSVIVSLE